MEILFDKIELAIIDVLQNANYSIDIAVSWLTNKKLFDIILNKSKNGLKVRLLIVNDIINNNVDSLNFQILIDAGVKLYMCDGPNLMHNKYSIVDDIITISGSTNWTNNMNLNDENIFIIKDIAASNLYKLNFEKLLNNYSQVSKFSQSKDQLIIKNDFLELKNDEKKSGYFYENLSIIEVINIEKCFVKLVFQAKFDKLNKLRPYYNIGDDKTTIYASINEKDILMLEVGDFIIYPKESKINISKYTDKNGNLREANWIEYPILKASDFVNKIFKNSK